MNWKHWPYWVKGGVVTGIIGLLLGVVFLVSYFSYRDMIASANMKTQPGTSINAEIFLITGITLVGVSSGIVFYYPLLGLRTILGGHVDIGDLLFPNISIPYFCWSLLLYIVIGIILGYLYGKFKNRKLNTGSPPPRE